MYSDKARSLCEQTEDRSCQTWMFHQSIPSVAAGHPLTSPLFYSGKRSEAAQKPLRTGKTKLVDQSSEQY